MNKNRKAKQKCCAKPNPKVQSMSEATHTNNYTYYCDNCWRTFTEFESKTVKF